MNKRTISFALLILVFIIIFFAISGWSSYKRTSSRIEDKYVIHLKRNSMLLEEVLTDVREDPEDEIRLDAFFESLNSIEMMMDLLTHNTSQSKDDYDVINSMWLLNSSVMTAIIFPNKSSNYLVSQERIIDDLSEIAMFYNEFNNQNHVKWNFVIKNWQAILDEYVENYPSNIYFKYYINRYEIK